MTTKPANGAASAARGDTIAPGVVSEYPPVNEAAVGAVARPCPICHGTGRYLYDMDRHPVPEHERETCRCCEGTGKLAESKRTGDGLQKEKVDRRTLRKGTVNDKTVLALQSTSYPEYCRKCAEAGFEPGVARAFHELRTRRRNRPEYVKGRTGPKTKGNTDASNL